MEIRRRPPNPSVKVASLEYSIPHEESEPRNILEKIIWEKDREVTAEKERVPLDTLKKQIAELSAPRDFIKGLRSAPVLPAVIAEVKKASPSKGLIRKDFDPCEIALAYLEGGASCISVLTDKTFFEGGFDVLEAVRRTVDLPILCKDFILTPYQLYQARAAGADAALLIAAILTNQDLTYLAKVASSIELTVLVEVHNENELQRVLSLAAFPLVGVNNRDLSTFETNLDVTERLSRKFSKELESQGVLLVSESGLFSREDLDKVQSFGARAVLVGESLMRQENLRDGVRRLIMG